ncbi:sugar ABC transporter substrate-binding protein [Paenibacillus sp. MY03]|uniref:ABC transporter substrate-binding protein n=1 Tax=Paenibacillus sp. MY03 TaxID=302980 RepID=UPI0015C5A181|nr:sugar ABC transporter substrate-binding protein [Paenibacillus sp. MY03]
MIKRNTVILFAAFVSIALLVSACSNNQNKGNAGVVNKDEIVTITYWGYAQPEYQQQVEKRVSEVFPNIRLKITGFPTVTGGGDPIISAAAAGTLPDLFNSNPTQGSAYSSIGLTQPLSTFEDFESVTKDVDQNLIESGRIEEGEVHNLIFNGANSVAMYYNTRLWAEAGLTEADIPKTWDELVEVAKKLTKDTDGDGRIDQYGIEVPTSGIGGGFNFNYGYPLYWSITGSPTDGFISKDGKEVTVDIPAYAKAIELVSDLVLNHKVAPPERTQDIFPTGTTAMMANGPHMELILNDPNKSRVVDEWDVFPMPTLGLGKATVNYMPVGGRTVMMSKHTKHPEEAWEVIKFLLSEEGQMLGFNLLGEMPVVKTVYDHPDFQARRTAGIFTSLENTEFYARDPYYYSIINNTLSPALDTVLAGNASPEDAVKAAVTSLEALVKEDIASQEALYGK